MNDLRRVIRDGLLREYHHLGCRTTELVHLLGIARATVQRALGSARSVTSPSRRALTGVEQWMLIIVWHETAGRSGQDPPPLGAQFLRSFCELCGSGGRGAGPRGSVVHDAARRLWLSGGADQGLEELYPTAVLLCSGDPRPDDCLAGPARFGLICAALGRDPWTAAEFITQHVSRQRCAVRPCNRCGHLFVSPSGEHRHCGCPPDSPAPYPVHPTRVARTGVSLVR